MNRSRSRSVSLAAVIAVVVALALAPAVSTAAAGTGVAQVSAKSGAKRGAKKKASTCTKRRSGKRRGGRARRSAAAETSARGKRGKSGKGRKRAKGCSTKRAAPKREDSGGRRDERPSRDPSERRREREEAKGRHRPTPQRPTAPVKVAPADGTYTATGAPGLSFTISDDGTRGRIVATVAKSDFSEAVCQTADVAVDVPIEISRSTGRSGLIGDQQLPGGGVASILGFVAADGSFGVTISTSRPYAPNPGSTCSAFTRLTGTLTR
ncbi:hypothetical protein VSS74_29975 [Conexibacter stalactiti]|uniref:Uncharacterized protein n=1 Tax=Conexibacter stalactiti TaxID=1940611 RepID=A0ABU4I0Z7_9ACTN|nr:hypothetical protein [Conexibacter stalactiti]MDW5598627.1 hypothetical protein [Conexibacter stalactiti]MEC5039269.1 hypothetical protein [Conexibacter stalactiti]